MPLVTEPRLTVPPPIVPRPPRGGEGGNNNDSGRPRSETTARVAIFVGMIASTMTFLALVSAMVVRRGLSTNHDWHRMPIPPLLWWNTAALLVSSVAVDLGRRGCREGNRRKFHFFWLTGAALGTWFLIGQIINWKFLASHGFYMQHNPASAFFYILTWAHAAHVVGALAALYFVAARMMFFPYIPMNRNILEVSAIFWHFLDVMWLLLMSLFVFWA